MIVRVKLYATLRNRAPEHKDWSRPLEVELPDAATVGDLIAHFGVSFPQAIAAVVNGTRRKIDWRLEDGDEVSLFPPMGGG